jgi:hypothetical protein
MYKSGNKPSDDEVKFCAWCRRQQPLSKGDRCTDCRRNTVTWNVKTEKEAAVIRKWENLYGPAKK